MKHPLESSAGVSKKFKDAPAEVAADPDAQAKPPCKYGAACYRANPAHRAEFWHPSDPKPSATLSHFEAPTQASAAMRGGPPELLHTSPQHFEVEDGGFENASMHDSPSFQKEKSAAWSEMGEGSPQHNEKMYEIAHI